MNKKQLNQTIDAKYKMLDSVTKDISKLEASLTTESPLKDQLELNELKSLVTILNGKIENLLSLRRRKNYPLSYKLRTMFD